MQLSEGKKRKKIQIQRESFYYIIPFVSFAAIGYGSYYSYSLGIGKTTKSTTQSKALGFGAGTCTMIGLYSTALKTLDNSADPTPVKTFRQMLSRSGPWSAGLCVSFFVSSFVAGKITDVLTNDDE